LELASDFGAENGLTVDAGFIIDTMIHYCGMKNSTGSLTAILILKKGFDHKLQTYVRRFNKQLK